MQNAGNPNGTILLASGGIDSTVLMHDLADKGELVEVISFDYGQASRHEQRRFLEFHTRNLGVPLYVQEIPWPEWMRGKGFIFSTTLRPAPHADAYEETRMTSEESFAYCRDKWDFLHMRNTVFLSYAVNRAVYRGVQRIHTAFQNDAPEWEQMDKFGYGGSDVGPGFSHAFNQLLAIGATYVPMRLETPYLDARLDKWAIARRGRRFGVDLRKTHSCEFFPACGECHQCMIRADVLAHQSRLRLVR